MIWHYVGELDQKGQSCGFGYAYREDDPSDRIEGTFLDNIPNGIGE